MKSADHLIARLIEWGVRRIYGYPGDGINGLLGALDRASEQLELIQVRHEELAAFMACPHAKLTGEVGVCLGTSGPGAIHLLNGLYDAKMDHVPVVAIVGQAATASLGDDYQQEVDLISLFKDVAHEYVHMAANPVQVRHAICGDEVRLVGRPGLVIVERTPVVLRQELPIAAARQRSPFMAEDVLANISPPRGGGVLPPAR